jgi:hypothetical protein
MEWGAAAAEHEAVDIAPSGNAGHRQLSVRFFSHARPSFGGVIAADMGT